MNDQIHILYVEDDPQSRKLMYRVFRNRLGIKQITIMEDSTNFIEQVRALVTVPDVIFLDIHVQPHNGFDMLAMLRQEDWIANTPIIALTASVLNEEIYRLRTAGFDGCLAKPIDLTTFPDMFRRILEGETIWRIIE